jgi:hypothetical protein
MKQFLSVSSNQTSAYIPEKEYFQLMSEMIFTSVEYNYSLIRDEKGENSMAKYPETETFRFFATAEALVLIRDRINDELKLHKKLAKKYNAE